MKGFTLLELMVVLMIVAILAAIAIPAYDQYIRRAAETEAMQEMQRQAILLEKHKARNFSYRGFPATQVTTPTGSTNPKYTIFILDSDTNNWLTSSDTQGRNWSIVALSQDSWNKSLRGQAPNQFSLLLSSTGVRCKTLVFGEIQSQNCGAGGQPW